jgi:hypothetical protein
MADPLLSRRGLLRIAAVAGLGLVSGCRRQQSLLLASRGDLPSVWSARLPQPWSVRLLDDPVAVLQSATGPRAADAALLQLSDGWATTLPRDGLQPIGTTALLERLMPMAAAPSRLFAPPGAPSLAFPWSFGPWVLVLRNRPDLARRAAASWDVLLDPSLRGRLVLPSSPRVSIALVGGDPGRLARLRRQAVAFDERDGLNLLLTGEAQAAVLPRQRVVPLLRRDPRLQAVLPESGAPLGWNLLVRPAGPHPEPPLEWLAEVLDPPLLGPLLAAGWVPPLPRAVLESALVRFPAPMVRLLLPPEPVLARCSSLPPLRSEERRRLQALWDGAAPPPAAASPP